MINNTTAETRYHSCRQDGNELHINRCRMAFDRPFDLKREVKGLKDCKEVVIVPIVIGALGTVVSKRFHLYLKKTGFEGSI